MCFTERKSAVEQANVESGAGFVTAATAKLDELQSDVQTFQAQQAQRYAQRDCIALQLLYLLDDMLLDGSESLVLVLGSTP